MLHTLLGMKFQLVNSQQIYGLKEKQQCEIPMQKSFSLTFVPQGDRNSLSMHDLTHYFFAFFCFLFFLTPLLLTTHDIDGVETVAQLRKLGSQHLSDELDCIPSTVSCLGFPSKLRYGFITMRLMFLGTPCTISYHSESTSAGLFSTFPSPEKCRDTILLIIGVHQQLGKASERNFCCTMQKGRVTFSRPESANQINLQILSQMILHAGKLYIYPS